MTVSVFAQRTSLEISLEDFWALLGTLQEKGYEPLILAAKRKFFNSFALQSQDMDSELLEPSFIAEYYIYRRAVRYGLEEQVLVAGDIFFQEGGLLYIGLYTSEIEIRRLVRTKALQTKKLDASLEVGFLGSDGNSESLAGIQRVVADMLANQGIKPQWESSVQRNTQLEEIFETEDVHFISATEIDHEEIALAKLLEEPEIRNLAITIRRAGGMLMSDLKKKKVGRFTLEELEEQVSLLKESGLLSQEYVVICKRTSNQVNRFNTREQIDKAAELGVRCSCGRLISEERIEELIVPTASLHRLLNQSYWMSAKLLESLRELRVPDERIFLNLKEGAEEIDAFVDVDGVLVMFELKDNEFSMGHAYPFSGRIGLYKPAYAVIVSTKGVDPDVKNYFKRVKPASSIHYVEHLEDLTPTLEKIIAEIRLSRAQRIIEQFEPMASLQISLPQLLFPRVGFPVLKQRRRVP